ncbi:MAG: class I SAM-dependent methyltransferase [archaeon]
MGDYNQFAEEYAERTAELEKQTREHFRSLLPDVRGRNLLDVGCGSGEDAVYYETQGAKVCGIDISGKEIEMARNRVPAGEFHVGGMENLPYGSGKFDIVTSVYALQASHDVPGSLGEMVRVARPGGLILVLAKHPTRNLIEGWQNDGRKDYFGGGIVTSHIFNGTITLHEPGHTIQEYLNPGLLRGACLEVFEEHVDFPASEQVIPGLRYPTYFIMGLRKK